MWAKKSGSQWTARANQKIRPPFAGSLTECSMSSKPESANKASFGRIEACMVQRTAPIRAHCFAMTKAGIEHQNSA